MNKNLINKNLMDKDTALEIAVFLDAKKAERVKVFDLRGITDIADYFVIASAGVPTQIDSLRGNLEAFLSEKGYKARNSGRESQSGWLLLDYDDCIVHLFVEELREFYNLERIWGDAAIVWPTG